MREPGTNNTVYPTYSCFDDALEFIDYVACEYKDEDTSMVTLVHGLMTGDDGEPHAHAWVEDSTTNLAVFAGILKGEKIYFYAPIDQFRKCYKITDTTQYTIREALLKNLEHQHFGPWEPKYVALCGSGDTAMIGSGMMKLGTIGKLPTRKETQNVATEANRK
jgi:hypothetical protein